MPPWPNSIRWGSVGSPGAGCATWPNTRAGGLALLGWQSGAFKCGPRDRWIGWRQNEQFPRLHLIANSTRMLMLCPPGTIANLASCVIAANLRRLSDDWPAHFGHPLELAEALALDLLTLICGTLVSWKSAAYKALTGTRNFPTMPLPLVRDGIEAASRTAVLDPTLGR